MTKDNDRLVDDGKGYFLLMGDGEAWAGLIRNIGVHGV